MKNWKIILLCIVTLSIAYWVIKSKAKKASQTKNTTLTISKKIPFALSDFLMAVGGKDNIKNVDATINNLKIELNNSSLLNKESLKALGAKGILKSNDVWTIIFGDFSLELKEAIKKA